MKKLFFMLFCGAMLISFTACEGRTIEGHQCVDLGLPSGTLWATCNVGADSPEDYGDYFAWGERISKSSYSQDTHKNWDFYSNYGWTKYNPGDKKKTLEASDDAATANWGGSWRMPTQKEQQELLNECTWTWTMHRGVTGCEVKGKNGKSIFLPATGHYYSTDHRDVGVSGFYWSSSLSNDDKGAAYSLKFTPGTHVKNQNGRHFGLSVRPVRSSK